MDAHLRAAVLSAVVLVGTPGPVALARDLTLEDRIAAQLSIERIRHSHQIDATRPFEDAVPRLLVEAKVRRYLKQTVALDRYWRTPITAAMLRAEVGRMVSGTRLPDRLLELFAALGDDPFLIQECLARPILVDRLARSFFESDEKIHARGREAWDDWWGRVEAGLDETRVEATAEDEMPSGPSSSWIAAYGDTIDTAGAGAACAADDIWDNGTLDDLPEPRTGHVAVWTGSLMIVWGGSGAPVGTGSRYDPATDTWSPMSTSGSPGSPSYRTAVWTGSEMIVWGGFTETGGRYDPVGDTWSPVSTANPPSPRARHSAVWTGTRMLVWGGLSLEDEVLDTGGSYDPVSDTWSSLSTTNAPAPREGHVAVWAGDRMVVWGGRYLDSQLASWVDFQTGGQYDPARDEWGPTSTIGAPPGRAYAIAVWTGDKLIVWGGVQCSVYPCAYPGSGGRYDPVDDTWSAVSETNAPIGRRDHAAVWSGDWMLVWGGYLGGNSFTGSGGRYDPATNSWAPATLIGAPSARSGHTAIWTGERMVVWGGGGGLNTGGRYDPRTDSWTPTATLNTPAARVAHTAVWTGNEMIVWGGYSLGSLAVAGGRYDPATDSWSPTSIVDAPSARERHTAVWTGGLMMIWGGLDAAGYPPTNTGARYDPLADRWGPMTTDGAPTGRYSHVAVWTGYVMVVWGGASGGTSGGRYDPLNDRWFPTSTVNVPRGRIDPAVVWTGREMIVWGGDGGSLQFPRLDSGGRYDPVDDSWSPTSLTGVPSARVMPEAVWTGSRMIVWGGIGLGEHPSSGGIFDPQTDSWLPTATQNAPQGRESFTAVWTGSRMIVWGGITCTYVDEDAYCSQSSTGGRYDPATDTWTATTTSGAPRPRSLHTAVWTGNQMIVWGGGSTIGLNSGSRYCSCEAATYLLDADGDGHGDPAVSLSACVPPPGYVTASGDCRDDDPAVWATPGEVETLLASDRTTFEWTAPASPGAVEVAHDLLRSGRPDDFGADAVCVAGGTSATTFQNPEDPDPGLAFFYLVRARNRCPDGSGPLGYDSSGTAIAGRTCP